MVEKRDAKLTDYEKNIIKFLSENQNNYCNILDLSKALKTSYPTTLKRVEILERLGFLKIVRVGNNKICLLEKKNG